ncbi:glucans biosynthesis glucosyltransferase MdoH [Haloferula sp. BvORR071]|uniref:glucans biosynthesis glucosyltransferase MdoH n=1 Tax=Haloferula sp. BvORR071 TaxID=1396141 RepID=UPI0006974EC8|nr:glucans biosynthesis glucosyltransferase MdoH [Haloferula sp. BvORR071]
MSSGASDGPKQVRPFFSPVRAWLRRFVFFGSVILVNLAACYWLYDLFQRLSPHRAHVLLLGVFFILNGLLVLGSFHALFGAWDILLGKKQAVRITKLAEEAGSGPLGHRYAVVMPVYNEDCNRFCARIEAIYRSIEATGNIDSYDFFILSDTRDLDLWVLEETAWTNLCRKLNAFGRIYYRRRKINSNRKAGNIGDFVRTWGGGYEAMVVLDADSLMDGGDIVKMTRVMEAYPNLGILQTPPKLIRGSSIFTRLQQFAMRLYGPLFIRGLNWWQLGGGSYWGHNALIRVKPFSDFCELPDLPGREPFGGKILSHDFVEAALMVSQGWEVWLAWDIEGTYEEAPPTLIDHLKRDRRWCQGNLQHLWLIFARKLPLTVRAHLFMGIMAYLGSPLWFLFLIFGTWLAWDRGASKLSNLPYDGTPVYRWLHIDVNTQSLILTAAIFLLLFLPKILALLGAIVVPRVRRSFGGFFPLVIGVCIETVLSMLLAPAVMLAHTLMVASIVLGTAVGWGSQNREADGTGWGEAFTVHAPQTFLGIAWGLLAWHISPTFAAWMAPITLGLVLSIPVSVLTSRVRYGKALARHKILSTPEELNPPQVLQIADTAQASIDPALDATVPGRHGLVAAVVDPYVNGVHVSLLEPAELTEHEEALIERCLTMGPSAMSKEEMIELMYLAPGMLSLHRAVWLRPSEGIHATWTQAVESYRRRLDSGLAEELV